jgi:hypothetical protein
MATVPQFFKKTLLTAGAEALDALAVRPESARATRDSFQLRTLPHEDVYLYCKKIDNSRLVREADPESRGKCWSAIGVACLALALLTGVLVPGAASTLAGYRMEMLRDEAHRLSNEKRALELKQAELLSPQRLEKLAEKQNLVTPLSSQVVHLDSRSDSAVAMVKK